MTFTKEEQIQAVYDLKAGYTLGHADIAILKGLARMALAGMEAEPVAYMYKDKLHADARFSLYTRFGNWSQEDINEYEITEIPLYTAPQPLTTSERAELENYRKAQVVQSQDDADPRDEFEKVFPIPAHVSRCGKGYAVHEYNAWSAYDYVKKWDGWNACRAAILQGKTEPVTTDYKLPFEQWLSQQTGTIDVECGCVMAEVFFHWLRVAYEAGNSPVIPDDVRRMDWLVSKTVDVREPLVYGSHSLFWSQTLTDEEDDHHATKLREQIDAAMAAEKAAAPQQEAE
ncbi:hypothetical protein [Lelliottia amnigena]|uniref:hypothetical protein n=1 Tax=Lelliottia amnigena TaxID=61646 RepID=UPI003015A160